MSGIKAVFNWSGGKDSALALHQVIQSGEYEVVALLTTINASAQRSSMHGIPLTLLRRQAESIGIPLYPVCLPGPGEMDSYEQTMQQAVLHFKKEGIRHFIFGDIFLHDVKSYREQRLAPSGIKVVEPLWGKSSGEVMDDFLKSGLKTIIVTTMADLLDRSYIGREIDRSLIDGLPSSVDVCGENGEYHTFCHSGAIFRKPVPFSLGEPLLLSHDVTLDDGSRQTFRYWTANLQSE